MTSQKRRVGSKWSSKVSGIPVTSADDSGPTPPGPSSSSTLTIRMTAKGGGPKGSSKGSGKVSIPSTSKLPIGMTSRGGGPRRSSKGSGKKSVPSTSALPTVMTLRGGGPRGSSRGSGEVSVPSADNSEPSPPGQSISPTPPTEISRERIRSVVHFLYVAGVEPLVALKQVHQAYGPVLSRSDIYNLYGQFRDGKTEVKDLPRSGRPSKTEIDGPLQALVQQNPEFSLEKLATTLRVGMTTVVRLFLKRLGYRRRCRSGYVHTPSDSSG